MSGQTRSNWVKFSNSKLSYKTCLPCTVLSPDSKKVIYVHVKQLQIPEIAVQK